MKPAQDYGADTDSEDDPDYVPPANGTCSLLFVSVLFVDARVVVFTHVDATSSDGEPDAKRVKTSPSSKLTEEEDAEKKKYVLLLSLPPIPP